MKNSYSLYYKPYALWKDSCQKEHSIEKVVEIGDHATDSTKTFLVIFWVTLGVYLITGIKIVLSVTHECLTMISLFGCSFFEFSGYIALIALYSIAI